MPENWKQVLDLDSRKSDNPYYANVNWVFVYKGFASSSCREDIRVRLSYFLAFGVSCKLNILPNVHGTLLVTTAIYLMFLGQFLCFKAYAYGAYIHSHDRKHEPASSLVSCSI